MGWARHDAAPPRKGFPLQTAMTSKSRVGINAEVRPRWPANETPDASSSPHPLAAGLGKGYADSPDGHNILKIRDLLPIRPGAPSGHGARTDTPVYPEWSICPPDWVGMAKSRR